MNRFFQTIAFMACAVLWLNAAEPSSIHLNLTPEAPGSIERLIGSQTDATVLAIKGPVDVRDLDFIASRMTSLLTLDLTDATIEAYEGNRALSSQTRFRANELPALSLAGLNASTIRLPSTLTRIGAGALAGCGAQNLAIPSGVTEIHSGAFATCRALTTVTVPAAIKIAGSAIFRDCTGLTQVYYNAPRVPTNAFAGCASLKGVYLGKDTETIEAGAFADCTSLSSVSYSGTALRNVGAHAFRNTALENLDLSSASTLDNLGPWALADNPALKSVTLPTRVMALGDGAFFNNTSLAEVSAISGFTHIGDAAWAGASSVDMVSILGSTTQRVGRYALKGMTSLTAVALPGELTYIGDHAFDGCTGLSSMNGPLLAMVPDLGNEVWSGVNAAEVTLGVPEHLIESFRHAPQWREFRIVSAGDDPVNDDTIEDRLSQMVLTGSFEGMLLSLSSTLPMGRVEIYDTLGRCLWGADASGADTLGIDTSRWSARIFIIAALSADGTSRATLKIAR